MYFTLHHMCNLSRRKKALDRGHMRCTSDTIPASGSLSLYLGILVPVCDTVKDITAWLQMASPKRITSAGADLEH